MFVVNSRLGLSSATHQGSVVSLHSPRQATLLPKLRVHFAEFLSESSPAHLRILSPPTCVGLRYGHPCFADRRILGTPKLVVVPTIRRSLPSGFSWQHGVKGFPTYFGRRCGSRSGRRTSLPPHATRLPQHNQRLGPSSLLRPRFGQTTGGGTGISTCCPSPTPFGLGLGPD